MTDSKITPLRGEVQPGEASQDVVDTLEALLGRAMRGEIVAVGYTTVTPGGHIATGWDAAPWNRWPLAAAIMLLHHRYAARCLEDE